MDSREPRKDPVCNLQLAIEMFAGCEAEGLVGFLRLRQYHIEALVEQEATGLRCIGAGLIAGIAAGLGIYAIARFWLQGLLFGVNFTDPIIQSSSAASWCWC